MSKLILGIFEWLIDTLSYWKSSIEKKVVELSLGAARSPLWNNTKREFAKLHEKVCPICGTRKRIELHHIFPFHLFSHLENDFKNLMWFCRDCHYRFAHLFSWRSYNFNIREDARIWSEKIKNRP